MAKKQEDRFKLDSDKQSKHVNLERIYCFGCQINTSNGSGFSCKVSLEYSNDTKNWIKVDSSETDLSGSSDSQFYDVTQCSAGYVRVAFSEVAGEADVEINYMLK